jgi:hypothetical protein
MQSDQDKEGADDHCQDSHGTPFASLAERRVLTDGERATRISRPAMAQ